MTEQPTPEPQANAPYEGALNIALNKLTSEVLLFLLAYTILLIGMAVFGSGLPSELRTLLYVIPILGVVAYVWLQKRTIEKRAEDGNVRVGSAVARKGAEVIGVRGPGQEQGDTTVESLFASDSRVIGRDYGRADDQSASAADSADVQYLVEIFQKLEEVGQNELMTKALEIQKRERQSHA
jgi:hypothetical protein